ncbi:hypothetical protein [Marisediminicola senii]|uniref:hypothetical protein n=1 Tax=Marisediminicola senii TaxID=2711233 RepID=UPI0013E9C3F7|nr:hypothetical protein [Marisediminicola senii]
MQNNVWSGLYPFRPRWATAFHGDFDGWSRQPFLLPGETSTIRTTREVTLTPDLSLTTAWTAFRLAAQKAWSVGAETAVSSLSARGSVRRAVYECSAAGYTVGNAVRKAQTETEATEVLLSALTTSAIGGRCAAAWDAAERGEMTTYALADRAPSWVDDVTLFRANTAKAFEMGLALMRARNIACVFARGCAAE